MGLKTSRARGDHRVSPDVDGRRKERFGRYFPRLFAYVRPWVGTDAQARDVVVEVFARAFAYPEPIEDSDFAFVLFGLAREACAGATESGQKRDGGLTGREREVMGLIFDAQMPRCDVARLLGMDERAVGATLVHGLRKLRASMASTQALSLNP